MSDKVIYCLPDILCKQELQDFPGMSRFVPYFPLYGRWVLPVDRTGIIKTPVRSVSMFPLPRFSKSKKTYSQLCDERAMQCLRDCEKIGSTMYVLYSGGIDSTCVLVSLLKHATVEQKKNIVVLLSHDSIAENPRFYNEHIRGKLRVGSSITFPDLIGQNVYLLSGEHNDMVLGSEKIGRLINSEGEDSIRKPYDREVIRKLFASYWRGNMELAELYVGLFEKISAAAPIPIETNMDFLWWTNFTTKWQACFYFILLFTSPRRSKAVTKEYLDRHFISFFNTDEFQLWSMNNPDKRIKDTWKSYKYVVKDYIYEYNRDAEYRDNKTKNGSLLPLIGFSPAHRFIDKEGRFRNDMRIEEILDPSNDFI